MFSPSKPGLMPRALRGAEARTASLLPAQLGKLPPAWGHFSHAFEGSSTHLKGIFFTFWVVVPAFLQLDWFRGLVL